jgi:glutamate decarboxylase
MSSDKKNAGLGTAPTTTRTSVIDRYFEQHHDGLFAYGVEHLANQFEQLTKISSQLDQEELQKQYPFTEISQHGVSVDEFLQECSKGMLPHCVNMASPLFMGHMTGPLPNYIKHLSLLKSTLNQNMVKSETAKGLTYWENQILAMMHHITYGCDSAFYQRFIHQPDATLGIVTSGGTIANITALQCARAAAFAQWGKVENAGLQETLARAGYKKSVVLASELSHYSIKKGMGMLGMGKDNLITIKTDHKQRIDVQALRAALEYCQASKIHVCAIVGVAGTTECGSFDPLDEMADLAEAFGCYFHVDGAWGGALLLSDKHKYLLKGIERADSVVIDGHKQLYSPMGLGMVLFKDPNMPQKIANHANYIIRPNSPDLGRVSLEGSRAANILYLLANLKLMGRQGYGKLLDGNILVSQRIAEQIEQAEDFQLLTQPDTNIFLYRYLPNKGSCGTDEIDHINIQIQEQQKLRGNSFVSRTLFWLNGRQVVALRIVVLNPHTRLEHGMQVLEEQRQIAHAELIL